MTHELHYTSVNYTTRVHYQNYFQENVLSKSTLQLVNIIGCIVGYCQINEVYLCFVRGEDL